MHRFAKFSLLLLAPALACAPGNDGDSPTTPAWDGGSLFDTGVAPIITAPVDSSLPMAAGDAGPALIQPVGVVPGAGAPQVDSGPGAIAMGGADAGPADAGPIMITIPTRSVPCGGSDCTTTSNRTCCQGWSMGTGFEGTPTCTTQAACTSDHAFMDTTNRIVMSDCDEASDCGGGQICCFVRYGMPVFADLFSSDVVGPGASRLCLDLAACNAGAGSISGVLGVPVGVVACKSNADCKDFGTCQPETNDSSTTGKGVTARPGVMVCR
jgi:hypothetical protein